MIGLFWNIRGLGLAGRIPSLVDRIRSNHVDVVGIMETKKELLSEGLLRSLIGNTPFSWNYLPARGSAGGILVGMNSDLYSSSVCDSKEFHISVRLETRKLILTGSW